MVVCELTSHDTEKCEARLHSMKGAVGVEIIKVDWVLRWGGSRSTKGTSCVRRVRLGSFQRVLGSSAVFCNEWLFMCA